MQNLNPRIGILCREGKTVYYAFLNDRHYFEHSDIGEVEFNLNLSDRQLKRLNSLREAA